MTEWWCIIKAWCITWRSDRIITPSNVRVYKTYWREEKNYWPHSLESTKFIFSSSNLPYFAIISESSSQGWILAIGRVRFLIGFLLCCLSSFGILLLLIKDTSSSFSCTPSQVLFAPIITLSLALNLPSWIQSFSYNPSAFVFLYQT